MLVADVELAVDSVTQTVAVAGHRCLSDESQVFKVGVRLGFRHGTPRPFLEEVSRELNYVGLTDLRVDFYVLGAQWLIGELTNSPGAGFGRFYPEAFAEAMAAHWAAPRAARARASIGMNPLQRETTGNAACRK